MQAGGNYTDQCCFGKQTKDAYFKIYMKTLCFSYVYNDILENVSLALSDTSENTDLKAGD